jgi:glycosyltransferase involved in cell wall biosynthesis
MKILYIDPFSVPNSMGGSQKSLLDIMIGMKDFGHEVILGNPGEGLLNIEAKKRDLTAINFFLPNIIDTRITLGTRRIFNIFAAIYDVCILFLSGFSIFLLIRKYKPDIVHANQILVSIAAGFACKLGEIPCVWHIRENPADHISGYVIKIFGILGFLFSDRIMVNSQYTANTFRNTSLQNKIVVIPIGIENTTDQRMNKSANSKEKDFNSTKVISIFGRITPRKGHKVLIRTLKILKRKQLKYDLLIFGHINENDPYYLSLLSLIDELGLIPNIRFCGFKTAISPILSTSDIIVAPSIESETFGRTIIEAMAAGKPVVATRVGAHPEIIEDGVTGFLVEPNNSKELADRIEKILLDQDLAKSIGERGRERYEEFFTLERYCKNIENIYEGLTK